MDKISPEIFSPFKTFYYGFIMVITIGKVKIEIWEFFVISLIIIIAEIIHNDYIRIILNNYADRVGKDKK